MIAPQTIVLPSGTFFLGAVPQDKFANSTELPRRRVEVTSFAMGVYPVTNREWAAFAPDHRGDPDLPVADVSWIEVQDFIDWLNRASAGDWRLPTEIEWEYACRAGSATVFSHGDELSPEEANFLFDESIERAGLGRLGPVGTYPPNAWGLHDLEGNVNEWTASPWTKNHKPGAAAIPGFYTIRGGSWDALPRLLRSSWRDGVEATARRDNLGLRLASRAEV